MVLPFFLFSLLPLGIAISQEALDCVSQERAPQEHLHPRVLETSASHPAYLHCKVPDGKSHMVAWTRVSDQAVLTAGTFSFTSDPRFQISKRSDSDWILVIRRTLSSDTGCYLCEVNTQPRSIVYPVYLHVTEQVAQTPLTNLFQGADEGKLMANVEGGEVVLNCSLRVDNTSNIDDVVWMRDGKRLDLNDTLKYLVKRRRRAEGGVIHTIRILEASSLDDGHYSCAMSDGSRNASQIVHVNWSTSALTSTASSFMPRYTLYAAVISSFLLIYYAL